MRKPHRAARPSKSSVRPSDSARPGQPAPSTNGCLTGSAHRPTPWSARHLGSRRNSWPGSGRGPRRIGQARLAGQQARRRALPHRRPGGCRAGGGASTHLRHRSRPARGPALDADPVPHRCPARAQSPLPRWRGTRRARGHPQAPRSAARARRADSSILGDVEAASREANSALASATEASDTWATGWALHVLAIVATIRGDLTGALPLYDRALAVTETDPALYDLGLLLQVNKAITLCNLDRWDEALTTAERARQLADQVRDIAPAGTGAMHP